MLKPLLLVFRYCVIWNYRLIRSRDPCRRRPLRLLPLSKRIRSNPPKKSQARAQGSFEWTGLPRYAMATTKDDVA